MKLGLLVVVAVVALVPSLSESRIVSKCELRDELRKVITLPRRLQPHTDLLLAIVTCEVERRSHLDAELIKIFGHRKPTAAPTTLTTAGDNETVVQTSTKAVTKAPTTTTTTTTTTTSRPPTTTAMPVSTNSSSESNSTVDGGRKKRAAPSKTSKESESEESLADVLNEEENKFDEEEMMKDDNHLDDDEEDDPEEDALEEGAGSRRDRRSPRRRHRKPKSKRKKAVSWSLGFYGIFQLSDSHFCDSGYRWSRNVCRSSCSAFTDDNIEDDVACFAKSGYWRFLLRRPSRKCHRSMKTYFAECH